MQPAAVVDEREELVLFESTQVGDGSDQDLLGPGLEQRAAQVMMIDDEVAILWTQQDRKHVAGQELGLLFAAFLPPTANPSLHLAHADGDLGLAKLTTGNPPQNRNANRWHAISSPWLDGSARAAGRRQPRSAGCASSTRPTGWGAPGGRRSAMPCAATARTCKEVPR